MKAQKRPREYRLSGFHAAKGAMSKAGPRAIDGRSALARQVRDWRAAVASDLGGLDLLSQQQQTLLDLAAQDVVLLSVADSWLRENPEQIVNKRRRALVPLALERLRIAQHLADTLRTLGLARVQRPAPTLREVLAKPEAERRANAVPVESKAVPSVLAAPEPAGGAA